MLDPNKFSLSWIRAIPQFVVNDLNNKVVGHCFGWLKLTINEKQFFLCKSLLNIMMIKHWDCSFLYSLFCLFAWPSLRSIRLFTYGLTLIIEIRNHRRKLCSRKCLLFYNEWLEWGDISFNTFSLLYCDISVFEISNRKL